jgi:hypothetical protein
MRAAAAEAGVPTNPYALDAIIKASETFSIVASQDIVDVRGLKLWGKGQPVSTALQQRLLERKLLKPLEACLEAENGVTPSLLQEQLTQWLDSTDPLVAVVKPSAPQLLSQVRQLPLHSVAQLLLTTALATRPHTLPHALQGMALAGAMAAHQRPPLDLRLAMLGGLLHDLGEVYIQPLYLDQQQILDLMGYKHLVVHPRVAELLLQSTTDYPPALCRAIGEHHERLDGSGYPARSSGARISPLGRLLAVMELTLGVTRNTNAPLMRASFALRVLPGEFDPNFTHLICNAALAAAEPISVPDAPATNDHPLTELARFFQGMQELGLALRQQGRSEAALQIIDLAIARITRQRVAWNALGAWGLEHAELTARDRIELDLATSELRQRQRELQRECLLLAERLSPEERQSVAPLWDGLLHGAPTSSTGTSERPEGVRSRLSP